ncbi:MAG TPA: PH domain-containing protein [Micromonospora sp.]|nr:PH domain-containing protein [Micromonospora sp.]
MSRAETVRFRYSQAIWIAAVIAFIGALPLVGAGWYFTPVLLVPLAVWAWGWRAGTDADPSGLRVRALLGERRIDWSEIVELAPDERNRVVVLLRSGQVTRLPAVRTNDLPKLISASGQQVENQ